MLVAQEIAARAQQSRDQAPYAQELELVITAWARHMFWGAKRAEQKKVVIERLRASAKFRGELARAIGWSHPQDEIAELTFLALSAARGEIENPPTPYFGGALDWKAWKNSPDLRSIQQVFDQNATVRDGFARMFGAYLRERHFEPMAEEAIHALRDRSPKKAAVIAVLRENILYWPSFQQGLQADVLEAMLCDGYEFRERIAGAVDYRGTELQELAKSAVEMWRTVLTTGAIFFAVRRQKRRSRAVLRKLESMDGALRGRDALVQALEEASQPGYNNWVPLQSGVARLFLQNPMLAVALWEAMEWPRPFAIVLREELRQVEERRDKTRFPGELPEPRLAETAQAISDLAAHKKLFGLALSGGGIRSATFNLGVLQKLCDLGLLTKIDYLSTVSGGGYIGAWLTGWIKRNQGASASEFRARLKDLLAPKVHDPRVDEQKPVGFLREYSNYLTPRLGGFSFDTWAMAAVLYPQCGAEPGDSGGGAGERAADSADADHADGDEDPG